MLSAYALAGAGESFSAIDACSPRQQVALLAEQMAAMARDKEKWDSAAKAVDDLRSVLHEHSARPRGAEGGPRSMMGFLSRRKGDAAAGRDSRAHSRNGAGVWNSLRRLSDRGNRRISAEHSRPDDARPGESASASAAAAAGRPERHRSHRPPCILADSTNPSADPRRSASPNRLSISPKSILRRQATSPPVLCLSTDAQGQGKVMPPMLQVLNPKPCTLNPHPSTLNR